MVDLLTDLSVPSIPNRSIFKTVSHFILTSALEQAEKTVQEHEVLKLNTKSSRMFFDALAAPVRFNRKLTATLVEHDRRVDSK